MLALIAAAVLNGLTRRFAQFEQRDDLIVASVSHPHFKLRWIENDADRIHAKFLLLQAMQSIDNTTSSTRAAAADESTGSGSSFFCFYDSANHGDGNAQSKMELYFSDTAYYDISSLQRHPLVMKVFIQKNTGLPSSASVERLFSVGGQILTPRRNKLSDEHFEMLLLLRVNKHLV